MNIRSAAQRLKLFRSKTLLSYVLKNAIYVPREFTNRIGMILLNCDKKSKKLVIIEKSCEYSSYALMAFRGDPS